MARHASSYSFSADSVYTSPDLYLAQVQTQADSPSRKSPQASMQIHGDWKQCYHAAINSHVALVYLVQLEMVLP